MLTWYMNKVPYTGNAVRDACGTGYGKTIVRLSRLSSGSNLQFLKDGF